MGRSGAQPDMTVTRTNGPARGVVWPVDPGTACRSHVRRLGIPEPCRNYLPKTKRIWKCTTRY